MAGFQIDPEHLRTAGAAMDRSGEDLHTQWQQLKASTQAIRFGTTDTVSPLIQMTLMGAVMIADDCFGSSKEAMSAHSDALHTAAGHYADAETTTSGLFSTG